MEYSQNIQMLNYILLDDHQNYENHSPVSMWGSIINKGISWCSRFEIGGMIGLVMGIGGCSFKLKELCSIVCFILFRFVIYVIFILMLNCITLNPLSLSLTHLMDCLGFILKIASYRTLFYFLTLNILI